MVRIGRIFELDASWTNKPPSELRRLREQHLRPHVDGFFTWVDEQRPLFRQQRGYTRGALEYAHNQAEVLTRFFDDGRLTRARLDAVQLVADVGLVAIPAEPLDTSAAADQQAAPH